ncbi:helix-turn-helix domain-containing protein [Streptomyces sp. NRRL F-2799]|uniref:helix-turn-helix domain-containing protein n=1 Tax=Streptomyces sp. NRRL F-2799 TaxID=1463844 RepID=UPI0004C7F106|nr:helix-turn-helix transcriptional regulator [Streptomyces sp. NRRL F-2799]
MTTDQGGGSTNVELEPSESLKTFGAVLKSLRELAGLTQEEFAKRVGYSVAYIAKIEQGKRFPPTDLPGRTEEALGALAPKVLKDAAKTLTRRTGLASWFQQWAGIEEEAVSLHAYECRAVPGLLQPEAYIRALFDRRLPPTDQEQIDHYVTARLNRQAIISTRPTTEFSFVIEQCILDRRMGGSEVTMQVIDHLLDVGTRRNVSIQIMPRVQEDHAGIEGPMYLAETPTNQWLGYTEGQRSNNLISTPKDVSMLLQRYTKLRSQALDCRLTVELLEQMRGTL